ncbi:uncharacterized protein [Linepithema humile]|uniref:uncharacterized protein n=1 Tax=Linepithema humile TaxID=83485 RepID=UPI0006232DE0|nr:PREDICTED: uncharacterized protein LOC105676211 [Linepithema humile]
MFRPSSKLQTRVKNKMRKKWRLFHATDFQSLMFPCFIICRILGIFPYSINGSNFQASKWRCILASINIVILCVNVAEILYEMNITKRINFANPARIFQNNCYYLSGGFIAIITYILSGPRMRLLQTVMEVSSRLPPESYQKIAKFIHAKDIIFFLFLIGQMCQYHYGSVFDVLYYFIGLYITLVVSYMDILYMNCVCVLKACFERINDNLASLRKIAMNDEPHFLEQNHYNQRNPFLLMELKALKKQHLIVSDVVQKLNIIFSLQLLATMVINFTQLTFSMYFVAEYVFKKYYFGQEKSVLDIYLLIFILFHSIRMVMVVWSCETGKKRAMEITTTVHDVLVSANDKEVKNELQLFSLQILHRDNTFSAKGLTVDATLLTAIVGSITTYLLILVQFMNAASICDKLPSGNATSSI